MAQNTSRTNRWTTARLTWLVLAALAVGGASTYAVATYQRTVTLRVGESYTFNDRHQGSVVVQCGTGGPGYPGGPGHPGRPGHPGGPSCSTFDFDTKLQRLAQRRDRLMRGECGYRRADGFMRCEGVLDRYEVQSQKTAFNGDLAELKNLVELGCRTRNCSQLDISRMLRDYDAFLGSVQFSRIVYERYQSVPFIDFPQQYRPNCSSW